MAAGVGSLDVSDLLLEMSQVTGVKVKECPQGGQHII